MQAKTWSTLAGDLSDCTRHLKELLRKKQRSRGRAYLDKRSPWLDVTESVQVGEHLLDALWAELAVQWTRGGDAGIESGIAVAADYSEMALGALVRCCREQAAASRGNGSLSDSGILPLCVAASLWRAYVRYTSVRYEPLAKAVWQGVFPLLLTLACIPRTAGQPLARAQRNMYVGAVLGGMPRSGLRPEEIFALDRQLDTWLAERLADRAMFPSAGDAEEELAIVTFGRDLPPTQETELAATGMAGGRRPPWWGGSSDAWHPELAVSASDDRLHFVISNDGAKTIAARAREAWWHQVEDVSGEEIFFAVGYDTIASAEKRASSGKFSPSSPGFRCGLLHKNGANEFDVVHGSLPEGYGGIVPGALIGCRRIGQAGSGLRLGTLSAVHRLESTIALRVEWLGQASSTTFQAAANGRATGTGLLLFPDGDAPVQALAEAKAVLLISGNLKLGESGYLTLSFPVLSRRKLLNVPYQRREGRGMGWLQLGAVDAGGMKE